MTKENFMECPVAHSIAGRRLRFSVPSAMRETKALSAFTETLRQSLPDHQVTANSYTGSIIIEHAFDPLFEQRVRAALVLQHVVLIDAQSCADKTISLSGPLAACARNLAINLLVPCEIRVALMLAQVASDVLVLLSTGFNVRSATKLGIDVLVDLALPSAC